MTFQTLMAAAAVAVVAPVAAVDPKYAKNITVFHINPHSMGAVPLNMDTANVAGDLFFDMFQVVDYALNCPEGPNTPSHGHFNKCVNPEAHGKLVVNQVTLEVDTRFSNYARCNIGFNNSDGHGHACKDGTYCCFCEDEHQSTIDCNTTLGFENITKKFGSFSDKCDSQADCYMMHSAKKLGGQYYGAWYSSLEQGCADPVNPTDDCTWRVVGVDAIINRTCQNDRFFKAVSAYNASCFDGCPGSNTSDPCHATCFYETAMGPGASDPDGIVSPETGIPTPQLIDAWLSGFRPVAEGGCARLPEYKAH